MAPTSPPTSPRCRYVLQHVFLGSFAMGSCAILALAAVFVGHAEAQIVRREARLKPARRLALAPHLPRPALASRVTWPRRLPQVTDGMYGQLAYGMATAVYQVRSSRPLAGAAPAPHSPSYPWRRCR